MKENLFQANSGQEQQQRRPAHKSSATCAPLQTHLACCLLSQAGDPLGLLAHPHCHLRHPPPGSHISMDSFFFVARAKPRECLSAVGCCRWLRAQLAAGAARALTGHPPSRYTRDGRRASRKFVIRKSSQDAGGGSSVGGVITTERLSMRTKLLGLCGFKELQSVSQQLFGFQPFGQT